MYKIHLNLDELTLSLLFSWVLSINSKSTYFLNMFWRLWNNAALFLSLLSFSQIGVYVLKEKQYMAKFALVFYGFLVLGNMFTTFFTITESLCGSREFYSAGTVFCLTGFF